jgi:hypothetical protein
VLAYRVKTSLIAEHTGSDKPIYEFKLIAGVDINSQHLDGWTISEEDVIGVATGDFIMQCEGFLSHSPNPVPRQWRPDFEDKLGGLYNLEKPFLNGTLTWAIPVTLTRGNETHKIVVEQKFILRNGVLEIHKGGALLDQFDSKTLAIGPQETTGLGISNTLEPNRRKKTIKKGNCTCILL